jgi:hypothetical protein
MYESPPRNPPHTKQEQQLSIHDEYHYKSIKVIFKGKRTRQRHTTRQQTTKNLLNKKQILRSNMRQLETISFGIWGRIKINVKKREQKM